MHFIIIDRVKQDGGNLFFFFIMRDRGKDGESRFLVGTAEASTGLRETDHQSDAVVQGEDVA